MNCQSYKNQIDEAAVTAELHRHLESCTGCKTFKEERECLHKLLGKLELVNAPMNFEFGVKAKLNSLPERGGNRVWARRFAFATPALAVAAVSAFVLTNYNLTSSPQNEPTTVAVQNTNAAPIENLFPVVSPTQQIAAAANANSTTAVSLPPKQTFPAQNSSRQVAMGNISGKQSKRNAPKTDKEAVTGRDIDEPRNSSDEALRPAAPPLIPEAFRGGVSGKVAASTVLSIFGIEKISEDGTVESVNSTSKAAEFGIASGDRIETINGQKLGGANLDNSFKQVKIEVVRNGAKRTVTMSVTPPK
jgi:hypothetical protein